MRRRLAGFVAGSVLAGAGLLAGLGAGRLGQPEQTHLTAGLAEFEPFVGSAWTIETRWLSGDEIQARQEFRALMGGRFVEVDTSVSTPDGSMYQKYKTIFAYDERRESIRSYTYTSDGEVREADVVVAPITDGGARPPLRSGWVQDAGGQRIEVRQEVRLLDEDTCGWKVWMAEPGSTRFQPIMDGAWKRGERLTD